MIVMNAACNLVESIHASVAASYAVSLPVNRDVPLRTFQRMPPSFVRFSTWTVTLRDAPYCLNFGFVELSLIAARPFREEKVIVVPTGNCVCGLNFPEPSSAKAKGCESERATMTIAATIAPMEIFVDLCIFRFT